MNSEQGLPEPTATSTSLADNHRWCAKLPAASSHLVSSRDMGGRRTMNLTSIAKKLFLLMALLAVLSQGTPAHGAEQALSISEMGTVAAPSALLPVPTRGPSGTPVAWGNNSSGQANVPADVSEAVALAGGSSYSLALRPDGTVRAWGDNGLGQTNVPAGLTDVVAIAAREWHSLALRSDGTVRAWGHNTAGETVVPADLTNVVAVAAGRYHSLALKSDGTVVAWGQNSSGQTSVPAGLTNVAAISAGGYHNLALKSDGTVIAWGSETQPGHEQAVPPEAQSGVVAIAAGLYHSLALKSNGTVVAWGANYYGQVTVPGSLINVVAIAAGDDFSLALRSDGREVAWGDNDSLQAKVPWAAQVAGVGVAAGADHGLALWRIQQPLPLRGPAGTVVAWGDNSLGQSTVPVVAQTGVMAVAAGDDHNLAVLSNGGVEAWGGRNYYGESTVPTVAQSGKVGVAAGIDFSLALKSTGCTYGSGSDPYGGCVVSWGHYASAPLYALEGVLAIAAGGHQALAVRNDGSLVQWDDEGTIYDPPLPLWQPGIGVVAAAGRARHGLALLSDGTVVAWGDNTSGQSSVPAGLSNVVAIAAGSFHSLALRLDGTVVAWGDNTYGQSSVPAGMSNVVAIAAGEYHSVALRSDGGVVAWGANGQGQTTVAVEARSGVVAIAAGASHTLALRVGPTLPVVSNVTSTNANGSYNAGDVIDITLQFSNVVNVTGTPRLTLATGGAGRAVDYSGGSGTTTLTFRYTVQPGDASSDLDYTSLSALTLNCGTIKGTDGGDALLTLPIPRTAGSLGANKALVIDTTGPATSISAPIDGWTTTSGSANVTATGQDSGSGLASIRLQIKATTDTTWSEVGTACTFGNPTTQRTCTRTATGLTQGSNQVRSIATDAAGNATTSTAVALIYDPNDAPVLNDTLVDPALTAIPQDVAPASNPGDLVSAITSLDGYITDTDSAGPGPCGVTNLALNSLAEASSLESSYVPASSAVDGSVTTRWSSEFSDPQGIQVDLGASYSICRVVLRWEYAYGRAYQIQVSDDATTWTTIYSTSTGDGGADDLTGLNAAGRYVRMYGTQRATQYGYSLYEFEVYERSPNGLAITAVDNSHGSWQYSTNGGSGWIDVSPLSNPVNDTSALLLAADSNTRVRFAPAAGYAGTATVTIRGWDGTSGTDGARADTTVNGGTTAFSTATDIVSIMVGTLNQAPTDVALAPASVDENQPMGTAVGTLWSPIPTRVTPTPSRWWREPGTMTTPPSPSRAALCRPAPSSTTRRRAATPSG